MNLFTTSISHSWQRLTLLAGLTAGLAIGLSAQAQAQTASQPGYSTSADQLQSPAEDNTLFNGQDLSSPFDLYHRADLANSKTPAEFLQQQRSILAPEIQSLREQQQQLLQGQSTQPATVTYPSNAVPSSQTAPTITP